MHIYGCRDAYFTLSLECRTVFINYHQALAKGVHILLTKLVTAI